MYFSSLSDSVCIDVAHGKQEKLKVHVTATISAIRGIESDELPFGG